MNDPLRQTCSRFLNIPDFAAQAAFSTPTIDQPSFRLRKMRSNATGDPLEDDLWAIVNLSHHNEKIRRSTQLTPDERASLYTIWYRNNPDTFLMLERVPADRHGISIVANTAFLALRQKTLNQIASARIGVIDLVEVDDICHSGEAFDVLLLDTWVVHEDYQDFDRRFFSARQSHLGYANALVLCHLSLFWSPAKTAPLRLFAEPDNPSVERMLPRLGFVKKSVTKTGKMFFELQYPFEGSQTISNALLQLYIRNMASNVEKCASWRLS